ncbi:MAG TPA: hypothetical protein VK204_04860 [Nocardioidaceae bacterium]|nr:hypothetical protein [Nocardioidaceae bacterium]
MTLAILDVIGDPVLAFPSIGPNGEALRAQVFSGQCQIGKAPGEKFLDRLSRGGAPARLGFYVPEAGPLRASYLLSTWAEVGLAKTQIVAGDYSRRGPYGVDAAAVQLVDDDRGLGEQWPYLWFTAYGGEPMVIRYRLTVTRPAD